MAELLIMNVDHVGRTPEKTAMLYKKGDVVVIMPDGHVWGANERPPKFRTIRLPGEVSDYEYLLSSIYAENGKDIIMRRRHMITPANLVQER